MEEASPDPRDLIEKVLTCYTEEEASRIFSGPGGTARLFSAVEFMHDFLQVPFDATRDPAALTKKAVEVMSFAGPFEWEDRPSLGQLRVCSQRWSALVLRLLIYTKSASEVDLRSIADRDESTTARREATRVEFETKIMESLRRVASFRRLLESFLVTI